MHRPPLPLLLTGPTRLAQVGRTPARLILAGIVLLLVGLGGIAASVPDMSSQIAIHAALVDSLRHGGGDYYGATAATLRGNAIPPTVTAFPPPAGPLAATLPDGVTMLAAIMLTGAIILVWFDRSRRLAVRINPVPLLALVGTAALARTGMMAMPAVWAGLLVTVALGLRRPDRWVEPAAIGLAAMMLAPAATLFALVMLVAAGREGLRREAFGWAAALAVGGAVIGIHLIAAGDAAGAASDAGPWIAAGPLAALQTLVASTGLAVLPAKIGVGVTALALAGWLVWRDPLAVRAAATILLVLLLAALLPADRSAVVLVIAPFTCLGLLPAADALRELIAAALDNRRITVTRVVR